MKVDASPILKNIGEELNQIQNIAINARKNLVLMHRCDKHIHMASSLSSIDIIAALLTKYIKRDANPLNKDWFILSKGHAAPALYAVLTEIGVIPKDELIKINSINSILQNHPDVDSPGVDMATGSLGQGLSFAIGIATWIKYRNGRGRVFVLIGDGEQDEGQIWEAITHAATLKLNNLIVIVDWNCSQLDDVTEIVKPKYYLPFVWSAIGWRVLWCDGHDVISIVSTINEALESNRPTVIFAKTIHNHGVDLNSDSLSQAVEEPIDGGSTINRNA